MAKANKKPTKKSEKPKATKKATPKPKVKKTEPEIVKPAETTVEDEVKETSDPAIATDETNEFSEFTIKEIMVQKNVDRERAIEILKNPQ